MLLILDKHYEEHSNIYDLKHELDITFYYARSLTQLLEMNREQFKMRKVYISNLVVINSQQEMQEYRSIVASVRKEEEQQNIKSKEYNNELHKETKMIAMTQYKTEFNDELLEMGFNQVIYHDQDSLLIEMKYRLKELNHRFGLQYE